MSRGGARLPLDVERLRTAPPDPIVHQWTADDVILYQLAIGAGVPANDPDELTYTYERDLKVLPSFGVIPAQASLLWLLGAPGFDVPLSNLLHGEQDLELHRPIPSEARTETRARVTDVYDKGEGSAAILVLEATTAAGGGEPLFTNRFTAFLRGEGGCGGTGDPPLGIEPPDRVPDLSVDLPTLPQQALLYRLCGDKNPMHADPVFARNAGFDRPFLHGLCTYGIACKAAIDHALGGRVERLCRYRARFAGIFFPGETLTVEMWHEDERVLARAFAKERNAPVLSNVVFDLAAA